jgi:hypothetical protein
MVDLALRLATSALVCLIVMAACQPAHAWGWRRQQKGQPAAAGARLPAAELPAAAAPPKVEPGNLFSSPDTTGDVVATYIARDGKPLSLGKTARLPDFQVVRQLPSLTKEQRNQIETLERELNLRISGLRESDAAARLKLEAANAHPADKVVIEGHDLPKAEDLKAQIADLNRRIEALRQQTLAQLFGLLSEQQKEEYASMKRGTLMLTGQQGEKK